VKKFGSYKIEEKVSREDKRRKEEWVNSEKERV
jgi:hypothetical protein